MLQSVRLRLTLWYALVIALILTVFGLATYFVVVQETQAQTDTDLADMTRFFTEAVEHEQREDQAQTAHPPRSLAAVVRDEFEDLRFHDYRFAVYDGSGKLIVHSEAFGSEGERARFEALVAPSSQMAEFLEATAKDDAVYATLLQEQEQLRAIASRLPSLQEHPTVILMRSLQHQNDVLEDLRDAFLLAIPLSLLLTCWAGYLLARRALAPVVSMAEQAERISAANFHERLQVRNSEDELGRLAGTFNRLLGRVQAAFDQQRRFMADASHELRTPLAIVRGEADVGLARGERSEAEYREILEVIRREGARLTHIVEDMFMLARADAGQLPLMPVDFYLDELAQDCARAVRSLAARRGVTVSAEADAEMPFCGDERLLRRMVLNLLDNAIKHTPEGGSVRLQCRRQPGQYRILVADDGIGIPLHAQSHIFERFYRVETAQAQLDRLRSRRGAGLGLPISQWTARAHRGELSLLRSDSSGSVFAVSLPLPAALLTAT